MTLDPGTVKFYQEQCSERIQQLMEKLAKDIPETETAAIRAEIRCYRSVLAWKANTPSTDNGVNFL